MRVGKAIERLAKNTKDDLWDYRDSGGMFPEALLWRMLAQLHGIRKLAERVEKQNGELREALKFYASADSWEPRGHPVMDEDTIPVIRDGGKKAREALAKLGMERP